MVDATPSSTPVPAQPVATVTNPEAPFPPADPLPAFVPPSVMDPVSNLDFLPVDDAFALEFRSETIAQFVGGDALRRGVSERIEAGRSHTNADRVAGRDRVRVHATLHEHTGHGLAEQAAHLHTTVDGTLDVHAASEDTVLLAGHMRELWDGGAAIVAAVTDDTAAGGGIRVTTLLDLWVHGLMGVEERIGTCTADAVLMESNATHYEREYGPGVHAAGLAVYAGSLYQSSRSSFRPLMRVKSGVRNLIAVGDGGGGGGDGGAGSAPGASPPPVPAHTGTAANSATGTLTAGRRVVEAPATTLDAADESIGARRVPLDELVNSVDARAAEEMGEAGAVIRAEDLPELTRSADTAERLGALQETLLMDGAESVSETAGRFRAYEVEGAFSMHPTNGSGGALEIEPSSAVQGENAPMVRPHTGDPWGEGPEITPGLLGGADRPPQSAPPESDFDAVHRILRNVYNYNNRRARTDITREAKLAVARVKRTALRKFRRFGGTMQGLTARPPGTPITDHAYRTLEETARQADLDSNFAQASAIREALRAINKHATEELQRLTAKYGMEAAPPTRPMWQPPATTAPETTVAAIPPRASSPMQSDWITAYGQVRDLVHHFSGAGREITCLDFRDTSATISRLVMYKFRRFGGNSKQLPPPFGATTRAVQAYRAMEDMRRRAAESGEVERAYDIRQALEAIHQLTTDKLDELTLKYGALDALSTQAMQPGPARVRPATIATPPVIDASTTVAPAGRLDIPGPEHRIVPEAIHALPEPAGGLIQATGVPGPPPASSLPGASLSEAGGAQAGDLGRWWLDPPAIGTTAAEPVATETIVTPSLAERSSFWLQPAGTLPLSSPVTVPFDSGPQHAGETVRPPPVTTTASTTARVPVVPYPVPSWQDDNFAIERDLIANRLPPGFDASRLIAKARTFEQFAFAEELTARRLPGQTIDVLIEGYRATDEGGHNAPFIEYLGSLKESIERALLDAYPERADPEWLDQVRGLLRQRGELAAPSAASATRLPEFGVNEIDQLLGTGEGVTHPPPLPPPSAAERTGAGAVAPPPAADPRRSRPPGMSGEPHPVAFDPWSAPPGPSSQVVYTEAMRTPVLSTGAPPGRQGAETPGFARAASGAVELPFSRREEIAIRFGTEDALLEAELALRTGIGDGFGWSARRWRAMLADLRRLNAIIQSDSAAAAAMVDVDWSAIDTLAFVLDFPPPSP